MLSELDIKCKIIPWASVYNDIFSFDELLMYSWTEELEAQPASLYKWQSGESKTAFTTNHEPFNTLSVYYELLQF